MGRFIHNWEHQGAGVFSLNTAGFRFRLIYTMGKVQVTRLIAKGQTEVVLFDTLSDAEKAVRQIIRTLGK